MKCLLMIAFSIGIFSLGSASCSPEVPIESSETEQPGTSGEPDNPGNSNDNDNNNNSMNNKLRITVGTTRHLISSINLFYNRILSIFAE